MAGTAPEGASAGAEEPEGGAESVAVDFDLVRDEPGSLDAEVAESAAPKTWAGFRLVRTTRSMAMRIQTAAVTTVILVNVSPAFVPKALEPPTPPKAPASPPPLPRWISIRQIRKMEARTIRVLNTAVKTPT
jgi:hypothetical protein